MNDGKESFKTFAWRPSPVLETFKAPLQHREVVLELRHPVGNGLLRLPSLGPLPGGWIAAPADAEVTALAPLDPREKVFVLVRH